MVSPAELYQDKFDLTAGLFITWHKVLVLIWTEILPTELKQVCVCVCVKVISLWRPTTSLQWCPFTIDKFINSTTRPLQTIFKLATTAEKLDKDVDGSELISWKLALRGSRAVT